MRRGRTAPTHLPGVARSKGSAQCVVETSAVEAGLTRPPPQTRTSKGRAEARQRREPSPRPCKISDGGGASGRVDGPARLGKGRRRAGLTTVERSAVGGGREDGWGSISRGEPSHAPSPPAPGPVRAHRRWASRVSRCPSGRPTPRVLLFFAETLVHSQRPSRLGGAAGPPTSLGSRLPRHPAPRGPEEASERGQHSRRTRQRVVSNAALTPRSGAPASLPPPGPAPPCARPSPRRRLPLDSRPSAPPRRLTGGAGRGRPAPVTAARPPPTPAPLTPAPAVSAPRPPAAASRREP